MRAVVIGLGAVIVVTIGFWLSVGASHRVPGTKSPGARPPQIPARQVAVLPPLEPQRVDLRPTTPAAVVPQRTTLPKESVGDDVYRERYLADAPPVAESWRLQNAIVKALSKVDKREMSLEAVDCKNRICRVAMLFDGTSADTRVIQQVFIRGTPEGFPSGFGAFVIASRERLNDGKIRTTMYLAREGELGPIAVGEAEPE